jgi:hypothetical protein
MACLNCNKKSGSKSKNKTTDNRGNKLKKYAFLRPEQLELLKQQEELENQGKEPENK